MHVELFFFVQIFQFFKVIIKQETCYSVSSKKLIILRLMFLEQIRLIRFLI